VESKVDDGFYSDWVVSVCSLDLSQLSMEFHIEVSDQNWDEAYDLFYKMVDFFNKGEDDG